MGSPIVDPCWLSATSAIDSIDFLGVIETPRIRGLEADVRLGNKSFPISSPDGVAPFEYIFTSSALTVAACPSKSIDPRLKPMIFKIDMLSLFLY